MTAALEYGGNSLKIADFMYVPEDPEPYNCSFNMLVKSGLWAGCAVGCECGFLTIKTFADELSALYDFQRQAVAFDAGYGNHLLFEMNGLGHLEISGEIYGNAGACYMKFRFQGDQTVLQDFIRQLKKMTVQKKLHT